MPGLTTIGPSPDGPGSQPAGAPGIAAPEAEDSHSPALTQAAIRFAEAEHSRAQVHLQSVVEALSPLEASLLDGPTHVVVTDNVDATTREKLEREYPGARVVTREWVASKRRGDATPVKTKKAPSPSRTRAVVPAPSPLPL